MQQLILVIHLLLALALIGLILLQQGKGADAGAAFGAGASGTVFGSRGTGNFLSRTTALFAFLFFATSSYLAYFHARGGGATKSIVETFAGEEAELPAVGPSPENPGSELPALPADPAATETPDDESGDE